MKGIRFLSFDVPTSGVWVITGGNGSGKSTILACLARIGSSDAFREYFPSSSLDQKLDSYSLSRVEYHADNRRVTYIRGTERWVPRPRREAKHTLDGFKFNSVIMVGVNDERIRPNPRDAIANNTKPASDFIIQSANEILATNRFNSLREMNVSRGKNLAFLIRKGNKSPFSYYSEKSFSSGEVIVLKMLRKIEKIVSNSLLVVDELEMALHPSAQVRLFKFLEKLSAARNLTIIFSTHSSTIIKTVSRNRVLHVEKDGERHVVRKKCYPSHVLASVAGNEERMIDRHILVEDEAARDFLQAILDLRWDPEKFKCGLLPQIDISYIGGIRQVLSTARNLSKVDAGPSVTVVALDKDARENLIAEDGSFSGLLAEAQYSSVKEKINFLPFTPECGVSFCGFNYEQGFLEKLREEFQDKFMTFGGVCAAPETNGENNRDACKTYYKQLIEKTTEHGAEVIDAQKKIMRATARTLQDQGKHDFRPFVGKLLS